MCNSNCIIFAIKHLTKEEVNGKKVIEIGSYDVNGSLRSIIESWNPAEYVGVDIEKGPGVDIVCSAEDVVAHFGKESFDVVISTELLEHVINWRNVISNIKNICKLRGIMLVTTRSYGYCYHPFPYDVWRYELSDMEYIFSDCIIERLEKDSSQPGVLVKAKKGQDFVEKNLSNHKLYSIITNKRVKEIDENSVEDFQKKFLFEELLNQKVRKVISFVGKCGLSKIFRILHD